MASGSFERGREEQKMDEAGGHEEVQDGAYLLSHADKSGGSGGGGSGEGFRWLRLGLM